MAALDGLIRPAPLTLVAVVFFAVPSAAPAVVVVAPFAGAPAAELRSVNHTVFGIFEHAFVSFGTACINAEHFVLAVVWIDAKGMVVHREGLVLPRQFLQLAGDVDMAALGAVLRTENEEFATIVMLSDLSTVAIVIVSAVAVIGIMIVFGQSAIPAAAPIFLAPVGASPATESASVKDAAVGEIKESLLAIGLTRIHAQHFRASGSRIGIDGVVLHSESLVMTGQFSQPAGDIYVLVLGAILSVENDKPAGVAIMILSCKSSQQQER
jgi:hypothetical protein